MATSPSNPLGFAPVGAPSSAQSSAPDPSNPLGFAPIGSQRVSTSQEESPQNISQPSDSNPLGFAPVGAPSGNQPVQKADNQPPPDEGLLAKTWRLANTPITEDLGLPQYRQGAGGFERGGEKILSGFTSPLSLMLTIGTLGTAGFLESAGANVLKETLMAGADGLDEAAATAKVSQFEQAAKAATNAFKTTGQPVSKAVEATGMPYNEFRALGSTLYDAGLTENDVVGGNLVQRGVSSTFRNLGVDAVKAQKIAKGTQFLMDTGFTGQQISNAVQTVPQVFDALKDGRYDDAAEYATEGMVSGALGLVGASHALHQAGETFGSVDEAERLRPSDENQKLNQMLGEREGTFQEANQRSANFENSIRKDMGAKLGWRKIFESKADEETFHDKERKLLVALDTGNDPELARQTGNALADAIGQPERKVEPLGSVPAPESFSKSVVPETVYHGSGTDDITKFETDPEKLGSNTSAGTSRLGAFFSESPDIARTASLGFSPLGAFEDRKPTLYSTKLNLNKPLDLDNLSPQQVDTLDKNFPGFKEKLAQSPNDRFSLVRLLASARNPEPHPEVGNFSTFAEKAGLSKDQMQTAWQDRTNPVFNEWERQHDENGQARISSAGQRKLKQLGYDGIVVKTDMDSGDKIGPQKQYIVFDPENIHIQNKHPMWETPDQPHPGLPENIQDLVQNSKLNDKQKAYVSKFVDAYHAAAQGLTDSEKAVYDKLRAQDDRNWNVGNTMGLINSHIENHIHHVWGPDTDVGNPLIQAARVGKLETSVTQARQRLWHTYAEGLLKGRQLVVDDPVSVIGQDSANIYKAAANRNLIDSMRDNFTRGSDGRPLVVMSGEAHALQDPNGGNPALMVNPNRVRDIRIAQNAVDTMRQTGDLDRFLNKGDIIDITPRVRPNNIDEFIAKFEKQGTSQAAQYDQEGNNVLRKNIETLKNVKNGTLPASALDDINAQQKAQYVWHPQDYVVPKDRTLQGWNWLAKTDNGTNVLARSDIKFHPEVADYLINRLGLEKSYLRENKGIGKFTKPILTGGKEAKAVLLSFSPFHLQQEALRAIMMGVNPIKVDPIGEIDQRPALAQMVRNNLTLAPDKQALEEHSIGVAQHSKLLSKIPVLGKAMDWYQDFLFNRYIPSMKAQAAEVMYDKYKTAHPDWTDDAVAKAAAEHTNNAFGGQNWRAMGRAAATQDWFHIFALAPDWLESEMRFAASTLRGGLGDKNFSREQVLKMAAGMWGVARVANLVNTGNMHLEAPFGLVTKDKNGREIIHSIRTLPTDILHMASDPAGFLKGRMSPFARLGEEAMTGRDTFGRKLAPGDLAIDVARNMAPIPAQAIGQVASGNTPSVGNAGQVEKAAGFTATVYRTEAQKLATQLSSDHDESGPLDPAKMQRYAAISKIEDGLRSGTVTQKDVTDAKDFGGLTQDEYKRIHENLKLTQGLDPETARMVTKVNRLPATDALKVWDAATPKEKTAISKIMIKKKNSYISKAMKDMTPQQRLNDPTFRRLRLMFQEGTPQAENQFPPAIIPQKKYPMTAVNDQGHRIGSHDGGQTWFDHETDEPITA